MEKQRGNARSAFDPLLTISMALLHATAAGGGAVAPARPALQALPFRPKQQVWVRCPDTYR